MRIINKEETLEQCFYCKEFSIKVIRILPYRTYRRGFTGRKGWENKKGRDIIISEICPSCGKKARTEEFKVR